MRDGDPRGRRMTALKVQRTGGGRERAKHAADNRQERADNP